MATCNRLVVISFALLSCLLLTETASAQGIPSARSRILSRPTVSPYLNLLTERRGGLVGLNYSLDVRPQLEARRTFEQQQRDLTSLQRQVSTNRQSIGNLVSPQGPGIRQTGHPTRFLNYSHYYVMPNRRR